MALKSKKPCAYPMCPELISEGKYCKEHLALARKEYNKHHRNNHTANNKSLYNMPAWKKASKAHLRAKPLCAECERQGNYKEAQCVDHIEPHNGDMNKFWNTENWQSLCNRCHAIKTRLEKTDMYLPLLSPSNIELIIVCGAPGSGKSTYVLKNKKDNDIVIDLDEIKAEIGDTTLYSLDDSMLEKAIIERNYRLSKLSNTINTGQIAWFITSSPTIRQRQHWRDTLKPKEIIVMSTSKDLCYERARNDERRVEIKFKYNYNNGQNMIESWFKRYEKDPQDTII